MSESIKTNPDFDMETAEVPQNVSAEIGQTAFALLAESPEDIFGKDEEVNMGLTRIPGGQTVPDN